MCFLLASWRPMTKIAGSGSSSQRHRSPDPDPYQNVMDHPQHCFCLSNVKWTVVPPFASFLHQHYFGVQGQSFLARQRQTNTRRQNYSNGQEPYDYWTRLPACPQVSFDPVLRTDGGSALGRRIRIRKRDPLSGMQITMKTSQISRLSKLLTRTKIYLKQFERLNLIQNQMRF